MIGPVTWSKGLGLSVLGRGLLDESFKFKTRVLGLVQDARFCVRRGPSALDGWIIEVLCCDPEDCRALTRILSMEGRRVRPC